ncbi:TPA: hypothetical protein ACTXXA_002062 [Legionella anisa]
MARNDSSSSVAIVALVVIVILVVIAAYYFFRENLGTATYAIPALIKEAPKTTIEMPKTTPDNSSSSNTKK